MSSDESYESSDDEDQPIPDKVPKEIKSVESVHRSYLNFKNLSDECVYLFWVDFDGKAISYGKINPGNRCDDGKIMHSFVSHPWFAISKQKNQFLLNHEIYFFPPRHETWHHKENGWLNQKWVLKLPEDSFNNPSTIVKNESLSNLVNENNDNAISVNNLAESSDNQLSNVASNSQMNVGVVELPEEIIFDFRYLDDSGNEDNDSNDDFDNLVDEFEDLVFNQPLVNITHREDLESDQYYEVLIFPTGCMSLRKLCLIKCCELFPSLELIDGLDIASIFKADIRSARNKYFSIITSE